MPDREDFLLMTDENDNQDFPLEDLVVGGQYLPTPYGLSDSQHTLDIIICHKGWFKQSPLIGFGVLTRLHSEYSVQNLEKEISIEVGKDGYRTVNGVIDPNNKGGFDINANLIIRK